MRNLYGIIPPVVTPFDVHEEVDEGALRAQIRWLVEEVKVQGIAVGGSTGEGHTLSTDELCRAVAAAVDVVRGRVPIVAGIIVDSTRQAIEKGRALADLPVDALQITPVHYLFKPNDEMMYRHFSVICDQLARPVLIYNVVPWSYCSPDLLVRLITEVEGVVGVKQSAGDLKLLADLLLKLDGRGIVMTAVDALLYPSFAIGAHGSISAIVTAVPGLSVRLWEAVQTGDHVTALGLHKSLLRIWNTIAGDNLPANVKTALAMQGLNTGYPRSPMPASSPAQRTAIREALELAGIEVQERL